MTDSTGGTDRRRWRLFPVWGVQPYGQSRPYVTPGSGRRAVGVGRSTHIVLKYISLRREKSSNSRSCGWWGCRPSAQRIRRGAMGTTCARSRRRTSSCGDGKSWARSCPPSIHRCPQSCPHDVHIQIGRSSEPQSACWRRRVGPNRDAGSRFGRSAMVQRRDRSRIRAESSCTWS